MKLLVLAQTPPPVHGQSLMVQTLVEGLPEQGIAVHHVPLNLSHDHADIGRWRIGKLYRVLAACLHAVAVRYSQSCDTLYYVPAPGKRGALYRDWMVMLLCRPFFKQLVLHWHAAGLGEWLHTQATAPERWVTRRLLGRPDLSIVLGEALRAEAEFLHPRHTAVIRNGITDPCPGFNRSTPPPEQTRTALYLGLLLPEKGVLDAIEAVRLANAAAPSVAWRLVLAGTAPNPVFGEQIRRLARESGGWLSLAGFVQGAQKHRLMMTSDALVFPTYYPAETQGLVVAEALAYDLPVIVTRWRVVAENLPDCGAYSVMPHAPAEIAIMLGRIVRDCPPPGVARRHFLATYTRAAFLQRLAEAFRKNLCA